ncbi:hypothetical protein [Rhodococcus opacus]|nr:hypothetical protein [Rhodococcus opacus]
MRGLGIGISVFFGWTTNGILALFFPSLVKEIGFTGSFFMFAVIGVRRLCSCGRGCPKHGAFPRGARRGRHDRRDLHRDALRAPSPNTNELCGLRLWVAAAPPTASRSGPTVSRARLTLSWRQSRPRRLRPSRRRAPGTPTLTGAEVIALQAADHFGVWF